MKLLFHIIITITALTNLHAGEAAQDSTKELIQHLLAQDLGTRQFPFPDVVSAATGKQVIPFQPDNAAHIMVKEAVSQAADQTLLALNQSDSPTNKLRRINEASRFFEDLLLKHLNTHSSISCEVPTNQQGRKQRSGYPDLLITHTATDGTATYFYLDPKLYEKKSRSSSLRTFYYEPRTRTHKILHDATHLLIGISHDGNDGAWTFTGWETADLSAFSVRLKAEFQASNKDIYRPHTIIQSSAQK